MSTNTEKISSKVVAAIVATGLMSFCEVIVETAMNVTFPILMREFSITTNQVQWMTSIYLLLVAIVVPLSAILKALTKQKRFYSCKLAFSWSCNSGNRNRDCITINV